MTKAQEFHGYPSYACWCVNMHIDNSADLYGIAMKILKCYTPIDSKARILQSMVRKYFRGRARTPEGAYISIKACRIWLEDNLAE